MTNSSTHRVTAILALVLAASTGFAHAQRRPPAPPNFDAFYELGPDSLIRHGGDRGWQGHGRPPAHVLSPVVEMPWT